MIEISNKETGDIFTINAPEGINCEDYKSYAENWLIDNQLNVQNYIINY